MASFNKVNVFVDDLAEGVHSLGADTLRVMLSNTAPDAADETTADITEITPASGYSAGGPTISISSSSQSGGTYKLMASNTTITAAASLGPFRYAVVYNDTPTSPANPLIGWYDYGSAVTLATGESFTLDWDDTNGILTLA